MKLPGIIPAAAVLLAACSSMRHCCEQPASAVNREALLACFRTNAVSPTAGSKVFPVFRVPMDDQSALRRPPVLLLHEILGLTPETLILATNYAARGFTVYAPLLFGKPARTHNLFGALLHIASSPDWNALGCRADGGAMLDGIEELAGAIRRLHPRHDLGVVGMCLTGAFPLRLARQPFVAAAICSQPVAPLMSCAASNNLGIAKADIAKAVRRARNGEFHVMAIRFEGDTTAPRSKHMFITNAFGPACLDAEIPLAQYTSPPWNLRRKAHPVLTSAVTPLLAGQTNHPAVVAFERSARFLKQHLVQADPSSH